LEDEMAANETDDLSRLRALVESFQWRSASDFLYVIDCLDRYALRIQGQDPDWDRKFRDAWGALDEVYAVMKDRGMLSPSNQFKRLILRSMEQIKVLLAPST
jgi:hypothetical protein